MFVSPRKNHNNSVTIPLKYNFFVQLEGTYSSWDSPYWDSVSFAMSYEFIETRYKAATLDYIRDQKIKEILGENETEK